MDTTFQEIIYQVVATVVSIVFAMIGAYAKSHIENDKVEKIIDNSIDYAEAEAYKYLKSQASGYASKMKSGTKLDIARKYINKRIDRETVIKYATDVDEAIERRLAKRKSLVK